MDTSSSKDFVLPQHNNTLAQPDDNAPVQPDPDIYDNVPVQPDDNTSDNDSTLLQHDNAPVQTSSDEMIPYRGSESPAMVNASKVQQQTWSMRNMNCLYLEENDVCQKDLNYMIWTSERYVNTNSSY